MKILSKYTLGSKIGQGYSGSVFNCILHETGVKYACKIISGKKNIQRNKHELSILKNLKHHNINSIYDVFHDEYRNEPITYIISELAEGDLFDYSKKFKMEEIKVKKFIRQILECIVYLHSKNICHCDLKLENILYTPNIKTNNVKIYDDVQLKLIDFEFSKYTHDNGKRKTLLGRNGTISFMAPEMLKHKSYSELVDIWSIGVITYSLLYNTYPIIYTRIAVPESFEITYIEKHDISENAIAFMKELLVENPYYRINAKEALEHKWLTI